MLVEAGLGAADSPDASGLPAISVVIPVRNGAPTLGRCLEALQRSREVTWECVVVDDGSTDDSLGIAERWGARVIRSDGLGHGPARARNLGAAEARAPLICFLDADVTAGEDTLAAFVRLFAANEGLAAAFGSYDAHPAARDFLSQYRNLMHHFVHQSGHERASTFWSGCGAIRRSIFLSLGGFDPRYERPSIEDIELGYRLYRRDLPIHLAKEIQVTHLKKWSLWSILKTDIRDRALPWTELIHRSGYLPNDLNLQTSGRISALCVFALVLFFALGWWKPVLWLGCVPAVGALLASNRALYGFLARRRGWFFLFRALPLHWLYFAYSALAFAWGTLSILGGRSRYLRWLFRASYRPGASQGNPTSTGKVASQ
ncbi:MAG: glycosyltransferase family 2 protein [Chloroflexota bacterium]